jgi:hypothetical protein
MGRDAEAVLDAGKALALKRNYADAFYLRGLCLLSLKEGTAACKDFVSATKLGNKDARKALKKYCK